jgi:hypothetical protein
MVRIMKRALVVLSLVLACTRSGDGASGTPGQQPAPEKPAIVEGDKAALKAAIKAGGGEFGDDDCAEWPRSFPRVVAAGSFAHDRGCDLEGLLVDGEWITRGGEVAGLATRGFAGATPEDKQKLARAWVEEVAQGFGGGFVGAPEPAFKVAGVTHTPVVVRMEGPEVVVEGWTREPSGMRWESAYNLVTYRFAADGKLSVAGKQRFAVEGERLEAAAAAEARGAQVGSEK